MTRYFLPLPTLASASSRSLKALLVSLTIFRTSSISSTSLFRFLSQLSTKSICPSSLALVDSRSWSAWRSDHFDMPMALHVSTVSG